MADLACQSGAQVAQARLVLGHCGLEGHQALEPDRLEGSAGVRNEHLEDLACLVGGRPEFQLDTRKAAAQVRELSPDGLGDAPETLVSLVVA